MTAALGSTAAGTPNATQVDQYVWPQFIGYAQRAPTVRDVYNPGTKWQDNSVQPPQIYETPGAGLWNISSLPVATKVAAAASPQTLNSRAGQVIFSTVSIAAGATQSFTINNSTISAASVVLPQIYGATAGAALTIVSVTPAAGSFAIVVTNGTGATTDVANLTVTFEVIG